MSLLLWIILSEVCEVVPLKPTSSEVYGLSRVAVRPFLEIFFKAAVIINFMYQQ